MERPRLLSSQETQAQRQRAGSFLKAKDKPGIKHRRPCCLNAAVATPPSRKAGWKLSARVVHTMHL